MISETLDPFGYWPAMRSRIRTLGGPDKADDPNYVFHTSYARVAPGPAMADVAFADLAAASGMIAIRIFQHRASGTPAVTEAGKITALLPSLAKTKRSIKLPFEALPDATYAVTGYVFGECKAQATAIDVTIAARPTEAEDPLRARSLFGRLKARHTAGLTALNEPSLSWPVSQGFTREQLREAEFSRLAGDLPSSVPAEARWETAYILRVLEQYGRLEPGARGLALSMANDPAATRAAQAGCDIRSVVLTPGETIADACARAIPNPNESHGLDFIWSRSEVFGTGGSPRAIGLIEELLERMRPGGLGIHIVRTGGEMDRHALGRVALGLAALGHIVAQLRFSATAEPGQPFGIVIRKSTDNIIG